MTGAAATAAGVGKIRLDYRTLSGSTNPAPGYVSGIYVSNGSIASEVWDTGSADMAWRELSWQETLHGSTDITFEVRAGNTAFNKEDAAPAWISIGSSSPVTSGLPDGRYMQWRATLTSNSHFVTPVLHAVTAKYTQSPDVETDGASSITRTSARLNGHLISLYSAAYADVSFQWGTAPGAYTHETTPQAVYGAGAFQADLSGLAAYTTYYYRAKAGTVDDGIGFGAEKSFTTSTVPPSVITNAASSITANFAALNGTLTGLGTAPAVHTFFVWGSGPNSLNNITPYDDMASPGSFQAYVTGLSPNTSYYFQAVADGETHGISYGAVLSFTTSSMPPSVVTGDAANVTAASATLNGDLANPGTATTVNVSFQYGTRQGGPYPNSTSPQAMTARGPFNANLSDLAGNTTYYFRAKGDGGAHGISYGSEMSFTTLKVPPSIATTGATAVTPASATLNGNLTSMGTAVTVNVSFQYGTAPGRYDRETDTQALTAPEAFQSVINGLNGNTTYYFRAKADSGVHGTSYGSEMSFATSRVPPSVTTNEATGVTADAATLKGTLTSPGTAPTVNVSFQYGTTPGMYSNETAPQAKTAACDFQEHIGGLAPDTTYYYRARADGGIHGMGYGAEHVFTTGKIPPSVTTNGADRITTNSAALNGDLTDLGTAATVNVSFQWGTQQGGPYPDSTAPQAMTGTGAFQAGLTGLTPLTMYYYRARADGGIHGTDYGSEVSFRTGMFPPWMETDPATGIAADSATLNGNLRHLGSAGTVNVSFVYGTQQGGPYANSTPPQAKTATGAFQANLSGLTSDTTYYYRAAGDGGTYGTGYGDEHCFTTSTVPPSVTTDDAGGVTADAATLNGNLDALGTAAAVNVSFQYGITPGGPYSNSTSPEVKNDAGAFHADIDALRGNTTYYFRTEADGGIYGAGYGAERSFTTLKVPPSVTTDNATDIAAASAILQGFLDSPGTAATVNVSFDWGLISGGPYNTTPLHAMDSRGQFQADINGLTALTTYYFVAKADGGVHGTARGSELSFTTGTTPPSVSTGAATGVTVDSATLNGTLNDLGTSASDNVCFQYGIASGVYNDQTPLQVKNAPQDFNANLTGLSNNTTYYYRAMASGGIHGAGYGAEHSFTTGARPPSVTTNAATNMTTDTAFLNGNLTDLGTAATVNVSFQYGTTAGGPYPDSTPPQARTSTGTFNIGVNGLTPFTTYYFRAIADGGIYGTCYGNELNFTTNHLPPVVSTGGATDIMTNAAVLNGDLDLPGSAATVNVSFQWGTSPGSYSNETAPQAMSQPDLFQARITGLIPGTTYYYRAKGDGGIHGTGYGAEHAFTTGALPPSVTTDNAGSITESSAVLNGNLTALGTATTVDVAFEWGTAQGGPYPNVTAAQAKTSAGAFQDGLTGLSAHTAYYFRARADGGIYGTTCGDEMSFITSNIPPSVITGNAGNITTTAATLNGRLDSLGSSTFANVSFQWGVSPGIYAYETTVQTMNAAGDFFADLTGLAEGGTYYFRAKAAGDGTVYGAKQRFTTLSPATPQPPAPTPEPPPPPHGSSGQISPVSPPPIIPANVVVQSASLSPTKVPTGTPVEITVIMANRTTVKGSTAVRLYVNGELESVRAVSIESGGTRTIIFTTVKSRPGTYSVYIEGRPAGSFTVEDHIDPNIILAVSLLLIFTSLVMGVIYIRRRRRQVY